MLSTMQDTPMSIGQIVRYGTTAHADSEVVTWGGARPGGRSLSTNWERRAAQLAHALRSLGIDDDQRVATFMWNNSAHMEAYLAVPAMGAVLHTLNIRLYPDQLVYIAEHAEDRVVIVDASLLSVLVPLLPRLTSVRHLIVVGANIDESPRRNPSWCARLRGVAGGSARVLRLAGG